MQKTVLNRVFETLLANGIVDSESEFSRDWCGRSESYLRGLRFHGELPSIGSIAICASKLQHYGLRLAQQNGFEQLANQFMRLSEACHDDINERSEATWRPLLENGSKRCNF